LLPSFEVENFRTFSHLQIPHLGGVNLIVGRNNVGKSMLLEALRLYAAEGDWLAIFGLLHDRDELLPGYHAKEDDVNPRLHIASLFHGRSMQLGKTSLTLGEGPQGPKNLRLEVGAYRRVVSMQDVRYEPVDADDQENEREAIFAITVSVSGIRRRFIRLDENIRSARRRFLRSESFSSGPAFVPARGTDPETTVQQWDAIALHEGEEHVGECLRIIAPIERITAVEHPTNRGGRMFLVRMKGESVPIPLKSLGDGMVRMFELALAMESARNGKTSPVPVEAEQKTLLPELPSAPSTGILLVDEIENGIHYTVLPDLWRFLFRMAKLHNVQVFATTHSWDCVEAFQEAAAEEKETEGMLLRLEKRDDRPAHKVVTYSEAELASATRFETEVR